MAVQSPPLWVNQWAKRIRAGFRKIDGDMNYVTLLIYLDDIIVYSKTFEAHLDSLREVLQRLRRRNLKLHGCKCKLFCTEVSFLGHSVSEQGIFTDPEKMKSIRD